jgi:hypothetical protein
LILSTHLLLCLPSGNYVTMNKNPYFLFNVVFIIPQPITVVARSKERCELGFKFHLRHGCLCAFILCLCCPVSRQTPCDVLIPRPKSPTDCVNIRELKNQAETGKVL